MTMLLIIEINLKEISTTIKIMIEIYLMMNVLKEEISIIKTTSIATMTEVTEVTTNTNDLTIIVKIVVLVEIKEVASKNVIITIIKETIEEMILMNLIF
jgi:hypothetical protein